MPEQLLGSCSSALTNLISSDAVKGHEDPFSAFSEGVLNFHAHYCLDDHTSSWCTHEKVNTQNHCTLNNTTLILHRHYPTSPETCSHAKPRQMHSESCYKKCHQSLRIMCPFEEGLQPMQWKVFTA